MTENELIKIKLDELDKEASEFIKSQIGVCDLCTNKLYEEFKKLDVLHKSSVINAIGVLLYDSTCAVPFLATVYTVTRGPSEHQKEDIKSLIDEGFIFLKKLFPGLRMPL